MEAASLVIYRKFTGGYGIFEGSDFDIEQAVDEAHIKPVGEDGLLRGSLPWPTFSPSIAKRHYHETGALRWYDTALMPR